jgi:hypothetical protein
MKNEKQKNEAKDEKRNEKSSRPPLNLKVQTAAYYYDMPVLYSYCLKPVFLFGYVSYLFARLEGQRFDKLQCNTADKAVHIIDSTNKPFACKAGHTKSIIRPKAWDAKASRYFLTLERTAFICRI